MCKMTWRLKKSVLIRYIPAIRAYLLVFATVGVPTKLSKVKMTPAIHKSLDDFDFAIAGLIAACHQAVFAFLRICPSFLVSGNSK